MISEEDFCVEAGISRASVMRPFRMDILIKGEDWDLVGGVVMLTPSGVSRARDFVSVSAESNTSVEREELDATEVGDDSELEDHSGENEEVGQDMDIPAPPVVFKKLAAFREEPVDVVVCRVKAGSKKQLTAELENGKKVRVVVRKNADLFQVGMVIKCHPVNGIYYYRGRDIDRWNRKRFFKKTK